MTAMTADEFCAQVKLFFWRKGKLPKREEFNVEFGTTIDIAKWDKWTNSEKFNEYCVANGITDSKYLIRAQLEVIDLLTNPSLPMTFSQKLKKAGVSPDKFRNWQKNPTFLKVLRERTNAMGETERHAVYSSLVDRASKGNAQAQRLYLELIGDYTPSTKVEQTNVTGTREIVLKLIEAIQRHVDPLTLTKITADFELIITGVADKKPEPDGLFLSIPTSPPEPEEMKLLDV